MLIPIQISSTKQLIKLLQNCGISSNQMIKSFDEERKEQVLQIKATTN